MHASLHRRRGATGPQAGRGARPGPLGLPRPAGSAVAAAPRPGAGTRTVPASDRETPFAILTMQCFVLFIVSICLLLRCTAIRWHTGCMCELKEKPSAPSEAIKSHVTQVGFGSQYFRVAGRISEFCPCSQLHIFALNEHRIAKPLEALLHTYFFRYFRVDLGAECPFWDANAYCTVRDCSVDEEDKETDKEMSDVDRKACPMVSQKWTNEADSSWTNEAENKGHIYADLLQNPEKYTGYKREAGASQVWHEIHAYNTFHSEGVAARGGEQETEDGLAEMPLEHRVFYKAVSGLHTSISSHISCGYLLDKKEDIWGVDLDQYMRRIYSHPERINNLHFAYLLVLRSVDVAADFLMHKYDFSSRVPPGAEPDKPKEILAELLKNRDSWPLNFDEESAFTAHGNSTEMLNQFRAKFYNISRIMDCVGCQRCRLWGKLQVMGLGTALRILYAPDRQLVLASLHRNHIVALLNLLGRLSHSIKAAQDMLPLMKLVEDEQIRGATLQPTTNVKGTPADDPAAAQSTEFKPPKSTQNAKKNAWGGNLDFTFRHGGRFDL